MRPYSQSSPFSRPVQGVLPSKVFQNENLTSPDPEDQTAIQTHKEMIIALSLRLIVKSVAYTQPFQKQEDAIYPLPIKHLNISHKKNNEKNKLI